MEPFTFEELPMAVTKLYGKMKKIEKLLKKNLLAIADRDDLLDIDEAAAFLKLSSATIYSKVCRREIPVNKQGKKLYFSKKDLKDWIKEGKVKTASDFTANAEAYLKENKLGNITKRRVT